LPSSAYFFLPVVQLGKKLLLTIGMVVDVESVQQSETKSISGMAADVESVRVLETKNIVGMAADVKSVQQPETKNIIGMVVLAKNVFILATIGKKGVARFVMKSSHLLMIILAAIMMVIPIGIRGLALRNSAHL
jgi:hypothetical protein